MTNRDQTLKDLKPWYRKPFQDWLVQEKLKKQLHASYTYDTILKVVKKTWLTKILNCNHLCQNSFIISFTLFSKAVFSTLHDSWTSKITVTFTRTTIIICLTLYSTKNKLQNQLLLAYLTMFIYDTKIITIVCNLSHQKVMEVYMTETSYKKYITFNINCFIAKSKCKQRNN